jgi:hypothetical protein
MKPQSKILNDLKQRLKERNTPPDEQAMQLEEYIKQLKSLREQVKQKSIDTHLKEKELETIPTHEPDFNKVKELHMNINDEVNRLFTQDKPLTLEAIRKTIAAMEALEQSKPEINAQGQIMKTSVFHGIKGNMLVSEPDLEATAKAEAKEYKDAGIMTPAERDAIYDQVWDVYERLVLKDPTGANEYRKKNAFILDSKVPGVRVSNHNK